MNKLFIVVGCSYEEQDNLQIFLCLEEAKEFIKECINRMEKTSWSGFELDELWKWFSIEMWATDEEGNWAKYQENYIGDKPYLVPSKDFYLRDLEQIEDYGIENGNN